MFTTLKLIWKEIVATAIDTPRDIRDTMLETYLDIRRWIFK